MALRVIITGVTGMVGEGVLHECLNHPDVEKVLVVGRRAYGLKHPRLTELVLADFANWSDIQTQLAEYQACFFCMGVSSVGLKEPEYTRLTYDLTIGIARVLAEVNANLTFCYVSGGGTDSSENGRSMWSRVKGRTENELMRIFPNAYMFRPGYMHPTPGLKNTLVWYKWLGWLIRFGN